MLRVISLRNIAYLINNHYISVVKQNKYSTLGMNKDRHIISELNSFLLNVTIRRRFRGS